MTPSDDERLQPCCQRRTSNAPVQRLSCRADLGGGLSGVLIPVMRLLLVALTMQAVEPCFWLQDSPLINAGLGSNLSESGYAECDASIMAGTGLFGAVGAVRGAEPVPT